MIFYSTNKDTAKIFYSYIGFKIVDIEFITNVVNIEEFSIRVQYSIDNITYSEFYETDEILNEISHLDSVYLGIEIIVRKFYNLNHTLFQLSVKLNTDSYLTQIFNATFLNNDNIIVSRRDGNLYDPYRLNENQKILQNKLSRDLSEIFGHKVLYFKAVHDTNDLDITFKELLRGKVVGENCKEIKIVIKNNHIPDNRPMFEDLEMSWENEFEVHIDKQVFKDAYGDLIPNSNDYFYLPISKRMYRVNAPYNEKNFMQNDPFWKVICVKWERRSNIIEDDFSGSLVDDLVEFRDDYYSNEFEDEKSDAVRPENDVDEHIGECNFDIYGENIFNYYFNYFNISNSEVIKELEFSGKEYTYNSWFKSQFIGNNIVDFLISETNSIQIKLNKENQISVTLETDDNIQQRITKTTNLTINKDKWYGLGVSVKNNNVLISLVDSNLNTLEELDMGYGPLLIPSNIRLYGGNGYANLRVNKKYLTQSTPITISDKLSELSPPHRENYIIINAVPKIK